MEDENVETSAHADAGAARRAAYERGEITRVTMDAEVTERRSQLDTRLTTNSVPQSVIDSWGRQPAASTTPAAEKPSSATPDSASATSGDNQ